MSVTFLSTTPLRKPDNDSASTSLCEALLVMVEAKVKPSCASPHLARAGSGVTVIVCPACVPSMTTAWVMSEVVYSSP